MSFTQTSGNEARRKEGFLKVGISINEEDALSSIEKIIIKNNSRSSAVLK